MGFNIGSYLIVLALVKFPDESNSTADLALFASMTTMSTVTILFCVIETGMRIPVLCTKITDSGGVTPL